MALDASEVRESLSDDSSAWESHVDRRSGQVFVTAIEADVGKLFKYARENGLNTDLLRDGDRVEGWLQE